MKPIFLLVLALGLSGCVTYHSTGDRLARARFGEAARLGMLRITPLALLEDSRCPAAVQCIRAGDLRISALIDGPGAQTGGAGSHSSVELTLGKSLVVGDATVTLVEATPERSTERTPYPEDYRFGFGAATQR